MPNQKLKNQIIEWLRTQDYWLQFAGNRFLEGEAVGEELSDTTYELYKEDIGLKEHDGDRAEIVFNEAQMAEDDSQNQLTLVAIKNIQNVNALVPGQTINVGPQLTLIYGGNGTGKSGYVRLLNNAFESRGDKEILKNVFSEDAAGDPSCTFTFRRTEEPYDLVFPEDKDKVEFAQLCVFDSRSVKAHLDEENKLAFTPSGFQFFEALLDLHEAIKQRLNTEIDERRPRNNFEPIFVNENAVRELIIALNENTQAANVNALCEITKAEKQEKERLTLELAGLKVLDKPKRIGELTELRTQVDELIRLSQSVLEQMTDEKAASYKAAINNVRTFEALTRAEGIQSLEKYNIAAIGSESWRAFINSSRNYAAAIEILRNNLNYPTEEDVCLFCLQSLGQNERELITAYWGLLKSSAETELEKAKNAVSTVIESLEKLTFVTFDDSTSLFKYVLSVDAVLAEKWKVLSSSFPAWRDVVTESLKLLNEDSVPTGVIASPSAFDPIRESLDAAKTTLINSNTGDQITSIENKLKLFLDRQLLATLKNQVILFVETRQWIQKAETALAGFKTNSITLKQGKLYAEHVTDEYLKTFNNECSKLRAPNFVNVTQKNERAVTLRKLKISDKSAMRVLSEGEQRSIAISDFITEGRMNPDNRGFFFDDPVSSQDHERRELIANRLVGLAKERQVVIFTHDIAFFIQLRIYAEKANVNFIFTTIRRSGDTPGIIDSSLPWICQKVTDRIKFLRDRLVKLQKVEKDGNSDDYLFEAKIWYELLREGWERAVEERLFQGVVERFSPAIQTQRLKKLVITKELLDEIEQGMTESSKWIHDSAPGLNPTPPDTTKAKHDLAALDSFATKCKAA